jgi:predicted kinase
MEPKVVVFTGLPGTGKSTLAAHAAKALAAPVFGWDWILAALRPYSDLQDALQAMDGPTYVSVGWSVMWNLTIAQLRIGRPVILDAVARATQIEQTQAVAAEYGASCLVVLTNCSDEELHRFRVEGRNRDIPGWHELDWPHVQGVKQRFTPPSADLVLNAAESLESNLARLDDLLAR